MHDVAQHGHTPLRRETGTDHRHGRAQHERRIVAAVRAQQLDEAAAQERCADQQHGRDCHLATDDQQPVARDAGTAAQAHRRHAVFCERRDDVHASHLKRWHDAEGHAGEHGRDDAEGGHVRVDSQIVDAWKIGGENRGRATKQQPGEAEAGGATGHSQQQALHRSCRTARAPLAPSAARMASSRRLAVARANCRLATLVVAMIRSSRPHRARR